MYLHYCLYHITLYIVSTALNIGINIVLQMILIFTQYLVCICTQSMHVKMDFNTYTFQILIHDIKFDM